MDEAQAIPWLVYYVKFLCNFSTTVAAYLSDYCVPVASADTRRHLRSANRQLLAVPRYRLNSFQLPALHSLELSPGFYPGPDHQWRLFQASA